MENDEEWRKGFEAMGSDPLFNDVEYMIYSANEAFLAIEMAPIDEKLASMLSLALS